MKRRTFIGIGGTAALAGFSSAVFGKPSNSIANALSGHTTASLWQGNRTGGKSGIIIKVMGVGGAGSNAVDHMIREGVRGVEFISCNTDALSLKKSSAPSKLQLGPGLGAGGSPETARELALGEREKIADTLRGAHMVFVSAGMGGGTGTGAAPVIAEVARELGIFTVAVVTTPFDYEGMRKRVAEIGVAELFRRVDSLIVIPNEKLEEMLGGEMSMLDAFKAADNVLSSTVGGIAETINVPGLVGLDFEDVRMLLGQIGEARSCSYVASGDDRGRMAAEAALASPLLNGIDLSRARNVLVSIKADTTLRLKDYTQVLKAVRGYIDPDAMVFCGATYDKRMKDRLRVMIVATKVA